MTTIAQLSPYLPYQLQVVVDYPDGHPPERGQLVGLALNTCGPTTSP